MIVTPVPGCPRGVAMARALKGTAADAGTACGLAQGGKRDLT
jgi:hypothetical protein